MEGKKCTKCGDFKDIKLFFKTKKMKCGFTSSCKSCISLSQKEYYINNRGEKLSKSKIYNQENKDKRNKYGLEYYYKNKEKMNEYHKQYSSVNKRNEYYRNYQKDRWINDDEYRILKILRKHIYTFLKSGNNIKNSTTQDMLGYSHIDFINNIGIPGSGEHIDHKIPIDWFLPNTPINIVWSLDNLQIISSHENYSKRNRYHHVISDEFKLIIKEYIKDEYVEIIFK